ncbi:helix-turn-helix transcriptional regulator [Candidatus Poribacteria bacterium]|nr:helix-turn-helix transcriptional regulator [Candidatus Poribacteria bacterium]
MSPRVMPENRIPDIVRAAIRVFSHKGYRLTQMDEIAEEAEVSKATLYYYFKSKAHLFQYVLETGMPDGGGLLPPPETVASLSEKTLLALLKKRLKANSRLESVQDCLEAQPGRIDVGKELAAIVEELWDITERNRVQIVILEKSLLEFPELGELYDKYARRRVLNQLEEYATLRIKQGAIRPLHSVAATARFMMEALAWFGYKQLMGKRRLFSKSEALPDLVSILVQGLKA